MENLMPKVAEMLGVEIGEEFKIKGKPFMYRINSNVLEFEHEGKWIKSTNLMELLNGEYEIIKKPWTPQENEDFYYIGVDGRIYHDSIQYQRTYYQVMYKCGNMFKTEEEITPEMIIRYVGFLNNGEQVFVGV